MTYGKIDDAQLNLPRYGRSHGESMDRRAGMLTRSLEDLLNSSFPVESWGTSFVVLDGGVQGELNSPMGPARVVVAKGYDEVGEYLRYIFEKKYSTELGETAYCEVWAVRIIGSAVVSDDRAYQYLDFNGLSRNERENGVAEIALSALYAIGACEKNWSPFNP